MNDAVQTSGESEVSGGVEIKLQTQDEAGNADTLTARFADDDIRILKQYADYMKRVRATTLLRRGLSGISRIQFDARIGLNFECAPYENAELHELLHVLRPLILEREAASFHQVAALLGRRFRDRRFSDHLKTLHQMFNHSDLSFYMQITIDAQRLFHETVLRNWLNGVQYHTDEEKAEAWHRLEQALTAPNARALVMDLLYGRVKALMCLEGVVNLLLTGSGQSAR